MTTDWNKLVIATYNAYLHSLSMCPGNHQVDYSHGHLYLDRTIRTKDIEDKIRNKARQHKANGIKARYNPTYNTFVLEDN